ncbi:MAG: oxygen-independent coproporphyrinogen III oxidase-like protein, partial [Pseudomonadota bacterium]|nr:oxygen-independent coproporphyrinogen III oxidase-like protein [Pseudomonadota bacterium]
QPPHLSLYQLTIEANTQFKYSPPAGLPDDEVLADMQDVLTARAAASGLERYEVSAYAVNGQQCRHNVNYWEFGDYIGIGAGAHSKISDQSAVVRFSRPRLPKEYLKTAGTLNAYVGERKLTQEDLVLEYMINALRLRKGFSLKGFSLHTGLPEAVIAEGVSQAISKGLLIQQGDVVRPTDRGFAFLSEIQLMFS